MIDLIEILHFQTKNVEKKIVIQLWVKDSLSDT